MTDPLQPLREQIDDLDARILELLSARARVALEVGEVKKITGAPVFRPEREAQVLARMVARNGGPLPPASVMAIYREIIAACRGLERRIAVAFLGPVGTYSEQAVLRQFGHSIESLPCPTIDEVFREVETGAADFGIVPMENSTEGMVSRTLDLLLKSPLKICGEVSLPIDHFLLTGGGTMAGVTRICAHPQALGQCIEWLDRNYPGIERVPVSSNGEAARLASVEPHTAAIASELAGQRYDLKAVAAHIQDQADNTTRFVVIGRIETAPSGQDHTSLVLSVPNRAGAVHAMLAPLATHGVSMTRFESRPNRQKLGTSTWTYHFFIDVEGHQTDARVAAALDELRSLAGFCKILGSYPVA